MSDILPSTSKQIRSTLEADGTLRIEIVTTPIAEPLADQVVVRIEAAPINPSDLVAMLAGGDLETARFTGTSERPQVIAHLAPAALQAAHARIGRPLPLGLEGAGTVVRSGEGAADLLGRRVALMSLTAGTFGQFCTVSRSECMPLPPDVTAQDGAALFSNPLTALAIVETLHQTGRKALVNTAAASNLGQMLVRICREDGIALVNVVRRTEHVELLRRLGAEFICNSSSSTFPDDLRTALRATGAMVAFDAIGGGTLASELLFAMETIAIERAEKFNPYGSSEEKRVYLYGRLDPGSTVLPPRPYGYIWGIDGWSMPPILEKAGPARSAALLARITANLRTTFASTYAQELSLPDALLPEVMKAYSAKATGQKCLINPWL